MTESPTDARRENWALALFLVAIAIAELLLVRARELWLDESHTALLVSMPLRDLMTFVRGDVHPPLYFLIASGWRRLFGDSEFALRSLSVVTHLISCVVMFKVARALWAPRYAWFATAILAFNPGLFFYATEVRGYSLAALWVLATVGCIVASERTPPGSRRTAALVGSAVFGAAAYYTHYMTLFIVAPLFGVWLLYRLKSGEGAGRVFAAGLLTCLLAAPWAPVMLRQQTMRHGLTTSVQTGLSNPSSLNYGAAVTPPPSLKVRVASAVANVASLAGVLPVKPAILMGLLALPILVAVSLGTFAAISGSWLAITSLVVVAANVAGMLALGIDARRYVLPSTSLIVLLFTFGAAALARWPRGRVVATALMIALVALNLAGTLRVLSTAQPRSARSVAATVSHRAQPGDVVVFENAYAQILFDYYARRAGGVQAREDGFPSAIRTWWASQAFKGWGSAVATQTELQDYTARLRRDVEGKSVWLVLFENEQYDPNKLMPKAMFAGARTVADLGQCGEVAPAACIGSEWHLYRIQY